MQSWKLFVEEKLRLKKKFMHGKCIKDSLDGKTARTRSKKPE